VRVVFPLSWLHNSSTHQQVKDEPVTATRLTQDSQKLRRPARDHRTLPICDSTAGRANFSQSCTKFSSDSSQTGSFPDAYNDNDPGSDDPSKHIHPRGTLHFPGPLMSSRQLPVDMTVASCHVVAMTDLIAIIHRKSRIPSRRTQTYLNSRWHRRHRIRFTNAQACLLDSPHGRHAATRKGDYGRFITNKAMHGAVRAVLVFQIRPMPLCLCIAMSSSRQ
jgi:hypothetical protein